MEENNNISKENLKEKASGFADQASEQASEVFEDVKAKVGEVLSDESIENIKGKASELASKASEELADFTEDAQEEFKEATTKAKKFIKDLLD